MENTTHQRSQGRRCAARTSSGEPCRRWAINGGTVCASHGGRAPQVRRSARLRLLELVDPAITTMAKIMNNPDVAEKDRLRAAENILDRAGYPRAVQVDSDSAKQLLLQRLEQVRDQAIAEQEQLVGEARQIIEGHVIDDDNPEEGDQ